MNGYTLTYLYNKTVEHSVRIFLKLHVIQNSEVQQILSSHFLNERSRWHILLTYLPLSSNIRFTLNSQARGTRSLHFIKKKRLPHYLQDNL